MPPPAVAAWAWRRGGGGVARCPLGRLTRTRVPWCGHPFVQSERTALHEFVVRLTAELEAAHAVIVDMSQVSTMHAVWRCSRPSPMQLTHHAPLAARVQRVSACSAHTEALEQLQERALAQDKALGVARDHIAELTAAVRERDDIIAGVPQGAGSVAQLRHASRPAAGTISAHDPAVAAQLVSPLPPPSPAGARV